MITENIKPVKIASAANAIEAEMIMNLLLNNDIPCFKKDNASGSYMNIYMGYSVFGEEIYVEERNYQKAIDILNEIQFDENVECTEGNEPDERVTLFRNPRFVARAIILIFIVINILFFILGKH